MRTIKEVDPTSFEKAKNYAIWLLSQRDYTNKRMREKLIQRGYYESTAVKTTDYLVNGGYIDDEDYAYNCVRRLCRANKGRNYIKTYLLSKGICDDLAQSALDDCYKCGEIDELAARKLQSITNGEAPDYKQLMKVKAFLLRRGFSFEEINEAIEKACLVKGEK